jgi:hypothetical protein
MIVNAAILAVGIMGMDANLGILWSLQRLSYFESYACCHNYA